ncbi:MAG: glycosyltransferase family 2 protein [Deltaproteobacteria bacterium]|nr:glycosyltransferase family 2 protein [Deltaproteobacteria bacterium]
MDKQKIAVVIPAYDVADQIAEVVLSVHAYDFVDYIIVVDDQCPHSSGRIAEDMQLNNVIVLYHEKNLGVGGAVITGYRKAMELDCDIIVKIDGDGQMDANYISNLIEPLIKDNADYTKGNRFIDFTALKAMPAIRLFGNSILSFFVKAASGYWNIMDPTNGFTAINKRALQKLKLGKINNRYFFESDMLINLNIINAVVKDIDIPAKYGRENSSLRVMNVMFNFPPKLLKGILKRIFLKYFLYDFNMASIYILLGLPIFIISSIFGIYEWIDSFITGTSKTPGTIMLVALPIIVSFQMLMQAIQIDINSVPKKDR